MKERPAFNLKKTIMSYNLLQVIFSSYIFYEACVAGWLTGYNWLCQDIDRDTDPNSKGKHSNRKKVNIEVQKSESKFELP